WGMYAYARSRDLGTIGALVAAIGWMFAGGWMLHVLGGGHYIILAVAWLPLVLLLLEQALRRKSLAYASAAGAIYALLILSSQPQWTFYAGLFIGLWTFPANWLRPPATAGLLPTPGISRRDVATWLGFGVWTALS